MYPGTFARSTPDKPAIIMSGTGETMTYAELHEYAERLANLFHAAGLRRGDHVALCMENRVEFLAICWGAHYAGLYYTAISSRLTSMEMAYIINDCGARAYITSQSLAADAAEFTDLVTDVELHLSVGGPISGYEPLEDLLRQQTAEAPGPRLPGNDMLYSSGTTGQPKGVKLPLDDTPLDDSPGGEGVFGALFGANQDSRYLSPAPLYHAAPLRFCRSMQVLGATVVIMERFDPEDLLRQIEAHRITFMQVVPTMFVRMLKLDEAVRSRYDMTSLESVVHAAAPCPIPIKRAMIDWWGHIIHEYYAGTEGNGFCYCSSEQWLTHEGTVGMALIGILHIVDAHGNELPIGEVGDVYFESDSEFEYHNDPEKTQGSRLGNGWSTLGDVGRMDEDGFLYLTDRKAFMIICGGVNVYPQEAENVLTVHPKVMDVAVFGVPHDELGEEVKAVVQPVDMADAGPALERELIDYCLQNLSRLKTPRSIDFREELPRHPTGKLYKRLLRDEYWVHH